MKITFLGLGAMGARMAARLVDAGHKVTVWNRTTQTLAGAQLAPTPRAAVEGAEVVISMVRDIAASGAVWLDADHGALHGMRRGSTALECSTLTPTWNRGLKTQFDAVGVRFAEAPVVGTLPQAEQGTLRILVGGDVDGNGLTALSVLGSPVEVGPIGQASALKLAVNTLFATQVAALGEVLGMMKTEGIDTDRGLALLERTPVFPPVLKGVAALIRSGDDAPRFPVELVEKDLQYASSMGDFELTKAVRQKYVRAVEAGVGERNLHAVITVS